MGIRPNSHTVEVHKPRALTDDDHDRLRTLLGVEPLQVPPPIAPWVTVDGRSHTAASRWLKLRTRQAPSTLEANARVFGAITGSSHPAASE